MSELESQLLGEMVPEPAEPQPPPPDYKLFNPDGVGIAAFLGHFIGGSVILGVNYQRLGKSNGLPLALLAGALLTAAYVLLATQVHLSLGTVGGIWAVISIGVRQLAHSLQGEALERHMARGGQVASNGLPAVVGLAFMALIWGGLITNEVLNPANGEVVSFGRAEVFYNQGATEPEARALGNHLQRLGWMSPDTHSSARVQRDGETMVIQVVVIESALEDQSLVPNFEILAEILRADLFPHMTVRLELTDEYFEVERTLDVSGRLGQGYWPSDDHQIYFAGGVTEQEAHAMADSLLGIGLLRPGSEQTLLLTRTDDGTHVCFNVLPERQTEAFVQASFLGFAARVRTEVALEGPLLVDFCDDFLRVTRHVPNELMLIGPTGQQGVELTLIAPHSGSLWFWMYHPEVTVGDIMTLHISRQGADTTTFLPMGSQSAMPDFFSGLAAAPRGGVWPAGLYDVDVGYDGASVGALTFQLTGE